jgi:hypothetical protein
LQRIGYAYYTINCQFCPFIKNLQNAYGFFLENSIYWTYNRSKTKIQRLKMRRNKRRLTAGLLGFVALSGASVFAWSAGAFEGGVTLAPETEETGGNYTTSVDDTASVLLGDGSATLNAATINNYGNNGMGVALQGAAVLNLNNAFITMTGENSVGFLFDNGSQTLNVANTSLGGTTAVALAQNGSFATLNLAGNDKINGLISTTADSTLAVNMSAGNIFRGSFSGNVNLALSSDSVLYLTGDSFISSMSDDLVDYSNIYLCGYTLTSSEGAIAGNEADCGDLIGGYGAPARPIDDTPKPDSQPDPTPTPQPDPTPTPQPGPTPAPQPDPTPAPAPAPEPEPQPVYHSGKGVYNPYTVDNVNNFLIIGAVALIGVAVSSVLIVRSLRKKKD